MGAVGQWRVQLQERPEYADGRDAFRAGRNRYAYGLLTGDAQTAWLIGWDDARDDAQPRPGEP